MDNIWILHGCMIPAGKEEHESVEELAHEYDKHELAQLNAIGDPLHLNHKGDTLRIGTVTDCYDAEDGRKLFTAEIDASSFIGMYVINAILNKIYNDVSYQHQFKLSFDDNTREVITQKNGIELSVCEKGRRPGTHIYYLVPKNAPPKTTTPSYNGVSAASENYHYHSLSRAMEAEQAPPTPTSSSVPAEAQKPATPRERVEFEKFGPAEHARHATKLREDLSEKEKHILELERKLQQTEETMRRYEEAKKQKEEERKRKELEKTATMWQTLQSKLEQDFGQEFLGSDEERLALMQKRIQEDPQLTRDVFEIASAASDGYRKEIETGKAKIAKLEQELEKARLEGYTLRYNQLESAMPRDGFSDPSKRFQPASSPSETPAPPPVANKRPKLQVPQFQSSQPLTGTPNPTEYAEESPAVPATGTPLLEGVSSASAAGDDGLNDLERMAMAPTTSQTYSRADMARIYGIGRKETRP